MTRLALPRLARRLAVKLSDALVIPIAILAVAAAALRDWGMDGC